MQESKIRNEDIIVVSDLQVQKGSNMVHLKALARLIWKKKPRYIVNIGDTFDFPSLSSYASKADQEGVNLQDDIDAGVDALNIIPEYINKMNKKAKKKYYKPEMHFTTGNHEARLTRFLSENPRMKCSAYDLKSVVEDTGWTYHAFLYPLWINNIMFNHFIVNPLSGKAVGGSAMNKLNKTPSSFVVGHAQQFQFERRQTMNGMPHFGVVAGSFYLEDEGYRGSCNTEVRGFPYLKGFINRYGFQDYDVNFHSIERLQAMYVKDGGDWSYTKLEG